MITARYPEGKLPSQVSRLTQNVLPTGLAVAQVMQTDETKSLVANVARVLDKQQQTTPSAEAAAAVQQLPARVYLQIYQEDQRPKAKDIQDLLRKEGLLVPGVENVSLKGAAAVKGTVIRYFNDSDASTVNHIRELLIVNEFPQTSVKRLQLKANPGTIEVWFGTG